MASVSNVNSNSEIEECNGRNEGQGEVSLNISGSRRTLLTDERSRWKFQDRLPVISNKLKLLNFDSASANFKKLAHERDMVSRSVDHNTGHGFRESIGGGFPRKIDWALVLKLSKEWFRNPMNLALFLWIICVGVSGAILFMVMTGMLNHALPKKSLRNTWFEVNNQILNALFTLMCLYQHPKRIYHLFLLCRWKPEDISTLRKIYCKNGTYKPHEWAHMMVIVILLHINCFAQYAVCGLNLGYKRSQRPALAVGLCMSVAIAAPAVAGVYIIVSPLGKDYGSEVDEEAQPVTGGQIKGHDESRLKSFEKRYSFVTNDEERIVESRPLWSGGILDLWDDISLAYLSLFCTFCVFGWNMERLGFGNMYVHIATFLLFCMAPFWIFNLAAINIDNEAVREALGLTGIVLCAFGLLYGGFWRIQMRKRFNLPSYTFCFGKPSVSDCALWLCCCWCALAQEVRTGNSYDIVEDKFYSKEMDYRKWMPPSGSPLVDNGASSSSKQVHSSPSPSRFSRECNTPERQFPLVKEGGSTIGDKDETMIPPSPSSIDRAGT